MASDDDGDDGEVESGSTATLDDDVSATSIVVVVGGGGCEIKFISISSKKRERDYYLTNNATSRRISEILFLLFM